MNIDQQLLKDELKIKEERINKLAEQLGLDGICLFKFMNYAWFTAGGTNRVITGSERGCSILLIIKGKKYVFAPRNEIERITTEQVAGQNYEVVTYDWFVNPIEEIKNVIGDKKVGSDVAVPGFENISNKIDRLRFSLTEAEVLKAKEIARICSTETASFCANVKPGVTEQEMFAELSWRLLTNGIRPAVLLIGTDERNFTCRHPVVTNKKLERYGLVSLVGEKWGIHVTLTRSFYYGKLPQDLKEKQFKVNQVDAVMIANTKVGQYSDQAFEAGKKVFAECGYPEEWKLHHQGGAIGYGPREFRAGERNEVIQANQMFGWNPTIQGTKSESTIIARENGTLEILDTVPQWWPTNTIESYGQKIVRPLILEI